MNTDFASWLDYVGIDAQNGVSWGTQVFIVVFVTLLISYIANRMLSRLHRQLEKTKTPWDDAFIHAARKPLKVLIWVAGLCFALEIMQQQREEVIFEAIDPIRNVGIIATMTWFILRFIKEVEKEIITREIKDDEEPVDRTTVDAITKLLRISVIITAVLIILQTLGFSISGVLAFGGIGGVTVGFAAKDLLANFFGAMMVYLDRPFSVGDWIRSPDRNIEGTVEKIGWRQTRIRTFDKRPLYVPNSAFSTIIVENPSRMKNRRIYETIGVRYDDMKIVAAIAAEVKQMLTEHQEIDDSQTLIVNVNAFNDSSVDFFVYSFTHTTEWVRFHEIKEDVMLKIADIVEKHGAEMAFPTTTLHVPEAVMVAQAEGAKA